MTTRVHPPGLRDSRSQGRRRVGRVLQPRRSVGRRIGWSDLPRAEVGRPVENYGKAFPDMHRELYEVYVSGDVVVVELALQGTHDGPLWLPQGIFPPKATEWTPRAGPFSSQEREDSAIRLLPVGNGDPRSTRRAGEPQRRVATAGLGVAPEKRGRSEPSWRLRAAQRLSPREDTGYSFSR
jgi:hypothetical protein